MPMGSFPPPRSNLGKEYESTANARSAAAVTITSGADQTDTTAKLPFQSAHLRQKVSRFGGMINESSAVHIPQQRWERPVQGPSGTAESDFNKRHSPAQSNVYVGIPGYSGYRPHGAHHRVMGEGAAPPSHARPLQQLDTSKQPYIMPVVGYSGHVRGSHSSYGTSHWKNSGAVNPNNRPAASRPWDGRDVAGRPHGGQTPGDFGRYKADPEEEQKRREAEEANEILELRSMGIRALLKKKPDWQH
jgi:hypothetical protein